LNRGRRPRRYVHPAATEIQQRAGLRPDGRKIKGFVYFQKMQGDVAAVTLRTDLVDAMTQQSFGRIEIPLAIGND